MSFHEIGGLCVFCMFLIHNILNFNWIKNVTKRLFGKETPSKLKFQWIVNALLFLSFLTIIITGLMIAKTLPFRINGFASAKQIHYFAAALSIILMGIHLGLHWSLFSALIKKISFVPQKIVSIFLCVLLIASVVWGGYSMATGSFFRWISAPFTTSAMGGHEMPGNFSGEMPGNFSEDMSEKDFGEIAFEEDNYEKLEMPEDMGQQFEKSGKGQMNGKGPMNNGTSSGGILGVLKVMAEFGSEMILIAFLTVIVGKLINRKK